MLKAFIQQLGYDGIVYANEFEGHKPRKSLMTQTRAELNF
jgi:hypothetical protein